jgi:glycosyltransferase involved in cell wall biosynthesis
MAYMPKVSVCSATYNHEKYVTEAIDSVLAQSLQDFELIITDDCSTDSNVQMIERFSDPRIKLIRHETNRGNMATSTTSYKQSSGQYVVSLTTDDVWEPTMLEILSRYLDENPGVLGVFAMPSYIGENSAVIPTAPVGEQPTRSRFEHLSDLFDCVNPFCCPTAMIRRSCFDKLGYFPRRLRQIHDLAYWVRMLFVGELTILPDRLLKFRLRDSDGNAGSDTSENRRRTNFEFYKVLQLYRENITSVDVLAAIFPEVKEHAFPLEARLLQFHLAHVALRRQSSPHRLFGLDLLYDLMSDEATVDYLRTTCDFDYPTLFRLEAEQPLFAYDIDGKPGSRSELELSRLFEDSQRVSNRLELLYRDLLK